MGRPWQEAEYGFLFSAPAAMLTIRPEHRLPAAIAAAGLGLWVCFACCGGCVYLAWPHGAGSGSSPALRPIDPAKLPFDLVSDTRPAELPSLPVLAIENGGQQEWRDAAFDDQYNACRNIIRQRLPRASERLVGLETARLWVAVNAVYKSDRRDFTSLSFRDLAGAVADGQADALR